MRTSTKPQMPKPINSNKVKGGKTDSYFGNSNKDKSFLMKKTKKG